MSAAPELRLAEPVKRPSGSETRKRGRRLTVRLSPAERAVLESAADRAGLSLGSYVRARVLEKPTTRTTRRPPVEKAALAQLLGQVGRIGGNLAQITRHLNFGDIDGAEGLPEALADLREMKAALMAALGEGRAVIISGNSRSNWRWFATHLTRADTNERVEIIEMRGLMADNVREAFREMSAVAGSTNCKNFFYHADLNPRAHEQLTPEQWREAADVLERELGLEGHARFIVQHQKNGRVHEHVVWSRIDPDTMTAVSDSHNYRRHELAARAIEQAFGLEPVESTLTRDKETEARGERGPENWETFRGFESGIDPRTVKAEITGLWQAADSGTAFKAALEEQGYILAKGDRRDFCVVDTAAEEHSLARRISGAKAAEIRARMADIDRDALPTVAEARAMALEAANGSAASSAPTASSEATSAPTAVPAAVRAEEARQFGPAPEWTEEVARELTLRFGDEYREPLAPEAPDNRDSLSVEQPGDRDALAQEQPQVAEPGEPRRASPWGRAWRAFADRANAFGELVRDVWRDETSGTAEAERGFAARLLDTSRELWSGLRGRNAANIWQQAVEDAADLTHELAASPDGEAKPKSWAERVRERAGQIWRNERGAVPDLEVDDALWEALQESGTAGDNTAPEEAPGHDTPEPDGPDFGLD